jgi:uncharacterized protein
MKKRTHVKPMIQVRHSPIHGYGVFALRRIRKGTTVIEYLGDRVSHEEADARYEDKDPKDSHTFLFTVDAKTVIDAGVKGNDARYINHRCDPNCESTAVAKRIFIEAVRTIQPGEELAYDYQIQRDSDDAPDVDKIFACRCGAKDCRGSMLEAPKKPRKRKLGKRKLGKRAGKSRAALKKSQSASKKSRAPRKKSRVAVRKKLRRRGG